MTDTRANATDRGYDAKWRRNRARFLKANPSCTDCGQPATVADHDPVSRRDLIARGEKHPDAWRHLKPRCKPCHDRRTGRAQPGGWHAASQAGRHRQAEQHPGSIAA